MVEVRARARPAIFAALAVAAGLCLSASAQTEVPEVVRDLIERAQRHQQRGEYGEALTAYREARRLGPGAIEIYVGLGAVHVAQGDSAAALDAFVAGLEIDGDERNLLFNAAVVALRLERFEEALKWVERALDKHARDADLRLLHAAVLERLGRSEQALRALEAADGIQPRTAQILFRLGNQLQKLGRGEEAVEAYRRALREDRSMLRAHYNLGAVLLELGRYEEALAAYEIALAPLDEMFRKGGHPDAVHALAYANLGAIHSSREDWAAALEAYDKTLRLEPGRTDALYNRGFVYYQLGEWQAARRDYSAALGGNPDLPLAYLHLGQMARRAGDCGEATSHLESGLERFDTTQRLAALEVMAFCYAELGSPDRAEAAFRDVLASSPDDPELLLGLGRLLRRQQRSQEARLMLERALARRPADLATELELLALAETAGDAARQQQLAERLLAEHGERPELWRVRWSLALLMLRQGRLAAARGHLAALGSSEAVPAAERPRVAALEAMAAAAEGDLGTARLQLQRAASGSDEAAASAVLDALDGQGAKAVQALAAATPADGPWTAYRTDLALLQWSLGRPDAARPLLALAEAAGDGNPAIAAALGDQALRDQDLLKAIGYFERAASTCASPAAPMPSSDGVLRVRLPPRREGLCRWAGSALRRARLQKALGELGPALRRGNGFDRPRQAARAVLADSEAAGEEKSLALYVRGVSRAATGEDAGALADLRGALEAGLPDPALEHGARLHLAVSLARQGEVTAARQHLEAIRGAAGADPRTVRAATLNLGILLDDFTDDGQAALELYEAYLRSGGTRGEVESWAARLREVYR